MEKTTGKKKGKKMIKVMVIAVIAVFLLMFIGISIVTRAYSGSRADMPQYSINYAYDHYAQDYPREEVTLTAGDNTLHAFIYGAQNDKALIVFSHGSGAYHEYYLNQIIWFVDHGYRVFAHDYTGCGYSEGKGWGGLPQSAKDLDTVLTYIENDPELRGMKKVLYGHSWGAYAVNAVLNYDHDVTAVVSYAAYNQPTEQMTYVFSDILGLGGLGKACCPFIWLNDKIHYGKFGNPSGVQGINKAGIPAMIVQGDLDELVSYSKTSIYSHHDEIKNDRVIYQVTAGYAHEDYFYSDAANTARAAFNMGKQELASKYEDGIPDDELKKLYDNADMETMNELNEQLFAKVTEFLDQAISG